MKLIKKLILTSIIYAFFISPVIASEFCDGFERGYITGYKQASGSGFDPFVPFCPFQPMKKYNDPDSDFEHGFLIGLKKGMQDGG